MKEDTILNSFCKKTKQDKTNLLILIGDNANEDHYCTIMEKQTNGKTWLVKFNKSLKVVDFIQL